LNLYEARIAYFQTDKQEKRNNKWCLISNVLLNIITGSVDNKAMKECGDALKKLAATSAVFNATQAMFEATVALGKNAADGIKKRNPKVTACLKKVAESKEMEEGTVSRNEFAAALMIGLCAARWCDLGDMVKALKEAWEPIQGTHQTLYSQLLWSLYNLSEDGSKDWKKEELTKKCENLLPLLLKPNVGVDELKQSLQSVDISLPDFDSLSQYEKFMELSFEGKINDALDKSKTGADGPYLVNIAVTSAKETDEKAWFGQAASSSSSASASSPPEEKKMEEEEVKEEKKTRAKSPQPPKSPVTETVTETKKGKDAADEAEVESASKSPKVDKSETKQEEVSISLKSVNKPDATAYKKVSGEELSKWASECENNVKGMRAEGKDKIKQWDVNKTANFVSVLPFYGFGDYYKSLVVKNNIDGAKFLGADLKVLEEWGFDHLAHRARLYSEIHRINHPK